MIGIELFAKYEPDGSYLPLSIHHEDTTFTIGFLFDHWLSQSVKDFLTEKMNISEAQLRNYLLLIGKVHDIGKGTLVFQDKAWKTLEVEQPEGLNFPGVSQKYREKLHHSTSGAAILKSFGFNEGFITIIGSHHGRWRANLSRDYLIACRLAITGVTEKMRTDYFSREWKAIIEDGLKTSGLEIDTLPNPGKAEQMLMTGILNMADWLASDPRYFPLFKEELPSCSGISRWTAAQEKFQITEPWTSLHYLSDEEAFVSAFNVIPRPVQKDVIEILEKIDESGILVIEAPMGSGKTEAALYAAQILDYWNQAGGLFYGLPTIATSNGIMKRIYSWAEKECQFGPMSFQLAHSKTLFNEDYEEYYRNNSDDGELIISRWMEKKKLRLCPNFVVGTIDYLLRMALKHNHVMLDHIGLAGKVVILDEIHCYDAYMNEYLLRALEWLGYYRTPVILLSATLHSSLRRRLIEAYAKGAALQIPENDFQKCLSSRAYPLLTFAGKDRFVIVEGKSSAVQQTTHLKKIKNWDALQSPLREMLKTMSDQGGCAGIIVNTVNQAQQLYQALLPLKESGFRLKLLHSAFTDSNRADKEKEILELLGKPEEGKERIQYMARQKLIVIGTQVLEQSLDIDVDWLITEACPIDLLLQRIGRLHRHPRKRPDWLNQAQCWIVGEKTDDLSSGTRAVYEDWLMHRTLKTLESIDSFQLPSDIPFLIEKVYEPGSDYCPADFAEAAYWADYQLKVTTSQSKANCYLLGVPTGKDIRNLLRIPANDSNTADGCQAVRDCGISIDVILILTDYQAKAVTSEGARFSLLEVPDKLESKTILRSKIRLPGYFTKPYKVKNIIQELEALTREYFSQWLHSKLLTGELVLPLNLDGTGELGDCQINYSPEIGLQFRKKDGNAEFESDQ